ncbi:MAG: CRTAC1 family protein [Pseudomonadota bacterium]
MIRKSAIAATSLSMLLGAPPVAAEQGQALALDVPMFREVAEAAGLRHTYTGPWEYFVGGGVAAFDCNGDRRTDLVLAGGVGRTKVFVNQSETGGRLKFEERPDALPARTGTRATGAYPIDINNDGHRDLVLLRVGRNVILTGDGTCRFKRANERLRFTGGRAWSTAFAATFEENRSFPTLAFGNYVDRSAPGSPWGTCHDNVLVRPGGDTGMPDYSEPQALSPGYCTLSLLFTDWNRSGVPSLRVTNDRQYYRGGQEQLWRIPRNGQPRPYRKRDGWRPLLIWGMGIAEADIDADGFPEYALTSMGDTKLQVLSRDDDDDRPVYRDTAFDLGLTAHRPYTGGDVKPSTGWHAEFADFNNDGRLDLFIAKGNVERMPDFAAFDPDNLLLGTAAKKFVEVGDRAGIALNRRGRGAAIADLNSDGMLDLVVVNRNGPTSVFRNVGARSSFGTRPMGNWLHLELRQPRSNLDAIGAQVLIKTGNVTQVRRVTVGGGHASGRIGFVHVGLGTAERAAVRVRWPNGEWSATYRVFANNFVVVEPGSPNVRYWYPPR